MNPGDNICKYRKLNNYTQQQLGDLLNVSAQAVSKWELGQSEPDIGTLTRMAKLFHITIDCLINDEEILLPEKKIDNMDQKLDILAATVQNPPPQVQPIGFCTQCGKLLSGETDIFTKEPKLICNTCHDKEIEIINAKKAEAERQLAAEKRKGRRSLLRGLIVGGVIGIVFFTVFIVSNFVADFTSTVSLAAYIIVSLILAYLVFAFTCQMFYDSWLKDFFLNFCGKVFKMPGAIFELSFDGIVFLIFVKIFLGILSLILTLVCMLFGLTVSFIAGAFSFPGSIYKTIKNTK